MPDSLQLHERQHAKLPCPPLSWYAVSLVTQVQLFLIPWTVACQAPLSRKFSRQEYWIMLPCPLPGDLPNSGIEPGSCTAGRFFTVWNLYSNKPLGLCSNLCPLSQWRYLTISSLAAPFSWPQSFPASGSFPMSGSSHQVAKVLELQQQSFQWIFRVDFL